MADAGEAQLADMALSGQDGDQKRIDLLKSMTFPPEFDQQVDISKVDFTVLKPWVENKVTELVGCRDEVVVEYTMSLLHEGEYQSAPDPKMMQVALTGFLSAKTSTFMLELWRFLLQAQQAGKVAEISGPDN